MEESNSKKNNDYLFYIESFKLWLEEEINRQAKIIDSRLDDVKKSSSEARKSKGANKILSSLNKMIKTKNKKNATNYLADLDKISREFSFLITTTASDIKKIMSKELINKYDDCDINYGTLKSNLEMIGAELSEKLQNQIFQQLNSIIYKKRDEINKRVDNIKELLRNLNLSERTVYEVSGTKSLGSTLSVISNIGILQNQTLDEVTYLNFNDNKLQINFETEFGIYYGNMDKIIENLSKKMSSLDVDVKYVVKNYNTLKEQYIECQKLKSLKDRTTVVIAELEKISELKDLVQTLTNVLLEFNNKIEKLEKDLNKYNFSKIIKKIYQEQLKEDLNETNLDNLVAQYVELSNQFRKAYANNDLNEMTKIRKKMDQIYESVPLHDRKKLEVAAQLDEIHEKNPEKDGNVSEKQPEDYLRELAIQELEIEGAFEIKTEEIAGDTRFIKPNKELLINQKIEEYIKITKMSPVQRALYINQKHGKFIGLTEKDLSPIEIEQFNLHYGDNLVFIKYCKELEKKGKTQTKVNTVYKDYIIAKTQGYTGSFKTYLTEKAKEIGINIEEINSEMLRMAEEGKKLQ